MLCGPLCINIRFVVVEEFQELRAILLRRPAAGLEHRTGVNAAVILHRLIDIRLASLSVWSRAVQPLYLLELGVLDGLEARFVLLPYPPLERNDAGIAIMTILAGPFRMNAQIIRLRAFISPNEIRCRVN